MNKIDRVYNAYNNVLDMLSNRQYDITPSLLISFDTFKKKYIENDYNITIYHKTLPHKMCVLFSLNDKNKLQYIKQLLNKVYEEYSVETDEIIIILNNKPNNIIKKFIQSSIYNNRVELFWLNILQINITKHILQPKFILLTEQEKIKILNKYDIKIELLPK